MSPEIQKRTFTAAMETLDLISKEEKYSKDLRDNNRIRFLKDHYELLNLLLLGKASMLNKSFIN